jgi:hypothetical protein
MEHMLSTTQLFDLLIARIIGAVFPYASVIELKKRGESWSLRERLVVFSPFIVIGLFAAIAELHALFCVCVVAIAVVTFFTTACDDLGLRLTRKFHKFLRALNSLAIELAQFCESLKVDFRSVILPVALPPPRRIA